MLALLALAPKPPGSGCPNVQGEELEPARQKAEAAGVKVWDPRMRMLAISSVCSCDAPASTSTGPKLISQGLCS